MGQNSSNTPKQPTIKLARLISFVGLLLLFLIANQPFNLAATLIFIVALLAVDMYQPIVQQVDKLDIWLYRGLQLVRWLYKRLGPVRTLLFRPVVRALRYIHQHLGRIYNVIVTSILIGLVIFLVFQHSLQNAFAAAGDFTCVHTSLSFSFCGTGIGIVSFPSQEEGTFVTIGLITKRGEGPFDTSRLRDSEVQAENLIFDEDQRVSADPHITLAVVTMLSRTADDNALSANVGLEDLRGAYLAQKEYNSKHQVKLRLVIANLGTRLTTQDEQKGTIPLVLEQLILYSKYDSTFRGTVGFPFSQAARNALDILKTWQPSIPFVPFSATRSFSIVSPSAMTDAISNEPNFYRVISSNQNQSNDILDFLIHEFKTGQQSTPVNVAVLSDPSDAYSANLASDFINAVTVRNPKPNIKTFSESYQVQNASSLKGPVADALADTLYHKHADFIFFAGYAYDIDALEDQVQAVQQQQHGPYTSIPILAGEGIYGLDRYAIHNLYSIVYSAVYASPVGIQDPFTSAYNQNFGSTPTSSSGSESYSLLPPHAILSYEATKAFLQALDTLVQHNKDLTQENMNTALATVSFPGPSLNGQSDYITFQGNNPNSQTQSNPSNRTDYVMCTDRNHNLHLAAKLTPGVSPEYRLHDISQCV